MIIEKAPRGQKLSQGQKMLNQFKSRLRTRVEHILGFIKTSMKLYRLRAIGKKRIEELIGLANLTYNMKHFTQWLAA
jgi:hypothetical protein